MEALVLGAAAGGGFPQWNCGCANVCGRARAIRRHGRARRRAWRFPAGGGWLLVGASPDLRAQILANPDLAPPVGTRDSPIAGVVLVSADVDGIAGLLVLREGHRFRVFAPAPILEVLANNGIFASLDALLVERVAIGVGVDVDTGLGLSLRLLAMPGKVALYQEEDRGAAAAAPAVTYAARIEADGRVCVVAPACARITDDVLGALADADLLFFDGTLFADDEMIRAGLSGKTGQRMGHVSVSGPDGALARLAGLRARRVFFHINNSNPMLIDNEPERLLVEAAGWEVAFDAMRVVL